MFTNKMKTCSANLYVISFIALFFMLLYVFVTPLYSSMTVYQIVESERESFDEKQRSLAKQNELLPLDKIAIIQGNAIPEINPQKIIFDQCDPAAQSVDGTENGPKSLFAFAYNKCSPDCCMGSPYSCNGGCVCLTEEQKKSFKRLRGQSSCT
jgi:hypothetical protein